MVLPKYGIQWKTNGGSFGFLSNSCFRILAMTEIMQKAANPAQAITQVDLEEKTPPTGSTRVARRPIEED